jgi:hypothetical protein
VALHLKKKKKKKTSDSSIVSDILALRGRVMSPLCGNTLSTGAEVAGTQQKNASNIAGAKVQMYRY